MSRVYEFGDAQPIVKVRLDHDGWEWFRDLCRAELGPRDSFLREVETADTILADPEGWDE